MQKAAWTPRRGNSLLLHISLLLPAGTALCAFTHKKVMEDIPQAPKLVKFKDEVSNWALSKGIIIKLL